MVIKKTGNDCTKYRQIGQWNRLENLEIVLYMVNYFCQRCQGNLMGKG
jgi:hypothetical protein